MFKIIGRKARDSKARENPVKDVLLEIIELGKRFGGVEAAYSVSFDINRGALVGLIGPNGAGKTTLVNLITKHENPDSGTILLEQEPIDHLPAFKVARAGVSRTYQQNRLFMEESIKENIRTALVWSQAERSTADGLSYPGLEGSKNERTDALLDFFGLTAYADSLPPDISHLLRKRAEIAQALAIAPKLLILDEPFGGLTHEESFDLIALLRHCREEGGLTILLIDHNMEVVMDVCEDLQVMHHGALIASGSPQEIRSNERVCKVYLAGEL